MEENRGLFSNCLFRYKDRLKTKKEIFEVINNGTVIKCHYFNYYFRKTNKKRLGILIRKFHKGTVDRNKVKRKIREIYRNNKNLFPYDIVIKIKKDIHKKNIIELTNKITLDLNNLHRGFEGE